MPDPLPYVVDSMALADLDQVMRIEQAVFSAPWSERAYRYEITQNRHSTMVVIRPARHSDGWPTRWLHRLKLAGPGPVLGYAGFWLLVDEMHISTIAVQPEWRGRGMGEQLLLSLLERGAELKAQIATLEVRVSNQVAQALYQKYQFEIVSRQVRYYSDNNEDAYIMITPPFVTPGFQANLRQRRAQLFARLQAESGKEPKVD